MGLYIILIRTVVADVYNVSMLAKATGRLVIVKWRLVGIQVIQSVHRWYEDR